MRWTARRALAGRNPFSLFAASAAVGVLAAVLAIPADGLASGAADAAGRSGPATQANGTTDGVASRLDTSLRAQGPSGSGQTFDGVAAVGALFSYSAAGKLGSHFCTASVVHSSGGDLAVTAAHCVSGRASQIAFVPGYADGKTPFGVWQVAQVYTDEAWQASQDPDDDVAFLRLSGASDAVPVEELTGAEQLGTGQGSGMLVQVIGYPDGDNEPVWCVNSVKSFGQTQLEFDCGGYTDGTSGGPFLADVSSGSGQGTVIGVIGGYEQGGLTPSVSYSPVFGTSVATLYQTAQAGGLSLHGLIAARAAGGRSRRYARDRPRLAPTPPRPRWP
jgi:V8-like Glu-specific endopeptidase